MTEWTARNLSVKQGGRTVVRDATLSVRGGELVALVGPNGAGKTTLMRAMLGDLAAVSGSVRLDGAQPARMRPADRARLLAWLPQVRPLAWPMTVRDIVALGRFAHGATPGLPGPADAAAVERALAAAGIAPLAARPVNTLSGGETARVHVARALAGETPLLAADEPTAALDPAQALSVMAVLRARCDAGGGALVILHDLALAARVADRVAVMHDGRLIADAPPREALTPALLARAFGLDAVLAEVNGATTLSVRGLAPSSLPVPHEIMRIEVTNSESTV